MYIKNLSLLIVVVFLVACNNKQKNTTTTTPNKSVVQKDSVNTINEELDIQKEKKLSIELKQERFIKKEDDKKELQDLLLEKKVLKKEKEYILDFKYPLLNENLKRSYAVFNDYINDYYVDIAGTVNDILDDREIVCDTIKGFCLREKRHISYKIFNLNDHLLSILFYKENFYAGSMHPSYTFDCMNFDLNRGVFMKYEDFFIKGSEDEFRAILNKKIRTKVTQGNMYYDCWQISEDDFMKYKNNFVINDDVVEYYFDDCIMCPSYTGSYSVKISLTVLTPLVKKHNFNPLIL